MISLRWRVVDPQLVLRFRQMDAALSLRWRGPDGSLSAIAGTHPVEAVQPNPALGAVLTIVGPAGLPGPAGAGITNPVQATITAPGAQSYALPAGIAAGALFVNGLMQAQSYYSVSAGLLNLPLSLGLLPGDNVAFVY